MVNIISSALSLVGTGVKGFFGVKESQAKIVSQAIQTAKAISSDDQTAKQAAASIIVAEAQSGYWLASIWRPLLMVVFAAIIVARWFGYMPPNMTEAEIIRLYDLVELGIGGYIGGRTLEKVVSSVSLSKLINKLVN